MAFDAGSVESRLTVDTSQFNRDLDAAKAKVKEFEDERHEVKIAAVFDTSSLSKARQMFAQLDQSLSNDAMSRLRSSPQGSVLGALNALFSPHQVTGAPSAQQAGQQGLLGQMINGPSGGTGQSGGSSIVEPGDYGEGRSSSVNTVRDVLTGQQPGNTSSTNTVRDVLTGQQPGDTATTDTIRQVLTGQGAANASTTDTIRQELTGQGPKDTTTTDTIKQKVEGAGPKNTTTTNTVKQNLDPASSKKTVDDAKANGGTAGKGWAASFTASLLKSTLFNAGGAGEGSGSSKNQGGLDKGLLGGIGPGILGTSFKVSSLVGLGAAGLGGLPALVGGVLPLGLGAAGAGVAALGAKELIGSANVKGKAPTEGPLFSEAKAAGQALTTMVQQAASGLTKPLESLFNQIPTLAKQVTPALTQIFSGSVAVIQPLVTSLVSVVREIAPGLSAAFQASGPLLAPLVTGLGNLVGEMLPGLVTLLHDAAPAVSVVAGFFGTLGANLGTMFADFGSVIGPSSVILKSLLDVVAGLLPVIGSLAGAMAGTLGPAFTAFAGAIQAVEPFLVTIGKIIAQFAGAVLADLGAGLELVANVLKATAPAFDSLAGALGQVFTTLENSGVFAQFGVILENLATPLGHLVTALVADLTPAIPPILSLFGQLTNVISTVGTQVLLALIPPLVSLAETALGAILKVLPAVLPLVSQLVGTFTADAGTIITQVGTALLNLASVALTKLLQAATPLIPALTRTLGALTPILDVLTPVVADSITAVANALAAVVNAVPSGVIAGVGVAVLGVVGAMKLWGTAATAVASAMEALTGSSVVSWLSGAVSGIRDFAAATEGATLAEKAMLASEVALDAVSPLGWVALGVTALGALAVALATSKDSYSGFIQSIETSNGAVSYNISGYEKAAVALQQYADKVNTALSTQSIRGGGSLQILADQATAASQQMLQAANNMGQRLTGLSGSFDVSQTQIEKWASAAGISVQKFGSSSESVTAISTAITGFVNKNAEAITSTASLSTNVAIFGNDVLSTTTQLDAFNAIWNTLVGNLLSKQEAVTQSNSQFDNLKNTIGQSGKNSDAANQSFQQYIQQIGASASTLQKNGVSVNVINQYLQTQINHIKSLGPLNKQQQADLQALTQFQNTLATSTNGLNTKMQTAANTIKNQFTANLKALGEYSPTVNTDVNNLANAILETGTKSTSTAGARAALIKDLENAGNSAQTSQGMVKKFQSQISALKGKTVNIDLTTSGGGKITVQGNVSTNVSTGISTSLVTGEQSFNGYAYAMGGLLKGGIPGKDSIPVLAMPGELIVPTSMVEWVRPVLGGKLPGFASGGIVGPVNAVQAEAGYAAAADDDFGVAATDDFAKGLLAAIAKVQAAQAAKAAAAAGNLHPTGSGATVQALMQSMAASVGWTGAEWTALNNVEMREAGYSLTATNPSSGAYGLAQFINGPSEYAQYGGSSTTAQGQITSMLSYIKQRYGDPEAAWAHEESAGWYGNGGMITEPVIGYGLDSGRRYVLGESGHEQVTPASEVQRNASTQDAMLRKLSEMHEVLKQQVDATRQVPRGVGEHTAAALNGAAHNASFRSRFPTGGW